MACRCNLVGLLAAVHDNLTSRAAGQGALLSHVHSWRASGPGTRNSPIPCPDDPPTHSFGINNTSRVNTHLCVFAPLAGRRRLQQGLTCGAAKALNPDTCKALCACVTQRNPTGPACAGPCSACADAVAACGASEPLPAACVQYSTDPVVLGCIDNRASGRRFAA